jgi:hypothetical protein
MLSVDDRVIKMVGIEDYWVEIPDTESSFPFFSLLDDFAVFA